MNRSSEALRVVLNVIAASPSSATLVSTSTHVIATASDLDLPSLLVPESCDVRRGVGSDSSEVQHDRVGVVVDRGEHRTAWGGVLRRSPEPYTTRGRVVRGSPEPCTTRGGAESSSEQSSTTGKDVVNGSARATNGRAPGKLGHLVCGSGHDGQNEGEPDAMGYRRGRVSPSAEPL